MDLSEGGWAEVVRGYAMELVQSVVPYQQGDSNYNQVVAATGWSKQGSSGTTCGFLCHWMLWKLGVRNYDILNWPAVKETNFDSSKNVDRIWNKGKPPFVQITAPYDQPRMRNPQLNALEMGITPKPGDIVMLKDPSTPGTEHVFVYCETRRISDPGGKRPGAAERAAIRQAKKFKDTTIVQWHNAESGQEHGTDAKFKTRDLILSYDMHGYTKITSGEPIDWAIKHVIGWLDLEQLDYDPDTLDKIKNRPIKA
jgi:hypothetical protein